MASKLKIALLGIFIIWLAFYCKHSFETILASSTLNSVEILFQVKAKDEESIKHFKDGIIPWISINNPSSEIDNLIGKDEVVINARNATLIIDYPLKKTAKIKIKSLNTKGFTRRELVEKISAEYHRIYKEEEESAVTKTIPIEERKGIINRNETDGKYGIWGHDIDDLRLVVITIRKTITGELLLDTEVES